MNKDYVRAYFDRFRNSHKGLKNLNVKVRSDYKDAFPHLSEDDISKLNFKGGYYPASNTVLIITNEHKDIKDLNKTIKHEVFGHHALNRLSAHDKLDLLETIAAAPKDSDIGQIRENLQLNGYQHLKDKPLLMAEEVFAHIAEDSYKTIDIYKSIPDPKQIQTKDDILDIVDALKNGIHHGVLKQQIHPKNNDEQFKIKEKGITMTNTQTKNSVADKDNTVVIRQAKIIEIPKDQRHSNEIPFESKKEAITYQVSKGNTHNFTEHDKKILSENFKEITSKAYKNYPEELKQSKIKELNNDIKKNPLIEKVKSFCKVRDAKQKAPEKSLGMER